MLIHLCLTFDPADPIGLVQPSELTEMIMKVRRYEDDVELRRRQVANLRLDASDLEAIRQLKGEVTTVTGQPVLVALTDI